jgi:hypothetical protein
MINNRGVFVLCFVLLSVFLFSGASDAAPPCRDRDNDGYFDKANCGSEVDCNDNDPAINPGAVEECTDGADNDCDGLIDIQDPDAVNCPVCYVEGGGCGPVDCDDIDPNINPGELEVCDDTIDNDCDSLIDANDTDCGGSTACSDYTDKGLCNDDPNCEWSGSPRNGTCNDIQTCTVTEDPEVSCSDGIDNDCDGQTDGADSDCSGPTACADYTSKSACVNDVTCEWIGNPKNGYCQDASGCTPTGLPDDNCDGIDDDCNGTPDDGYVVTPTNCGVGACSSTGQLECQGGVVVDTCNPGPISEPHDTTCDGIDGDCDGSTDEDYTMSTTNCGIGACESTGLLECQGGVEVDSCTPGTPALNDETCNGIDDDCDSQTDEDYVVTPTSCGVGECSSSGQIECQSGSEVDTCLPGTPETEGPSGDPTCLDTLDNDCDGDTDVADPGCASAGECVSCHNGVPGSTYVSRDVVGGDYTQSSRHVFGGSVTNWDCILCHREGDANDAATGTVTTTSFHPFGNGTVDMRDVDNPSQGWVWDKNNVTDAMLTDMDTFCMKCHDSDSSRGAGLGGASGIAVATGDGGVTLSPSLDERMKPFNSTDGLDAGTGGGTLTLSGYERTAVLDSYGMFDPLNDSHHAVRGQAYTSHNANWGDGAWVDRTLSSGQSLIGVYESATLHCADCHTVDQSAHGSANGFMLKASSIDGTCYLCHNSNVYSNNYSPLTRWSHDNESNVWDTGKWAKIGEYNGNTGSACLNCHGGNIGEGGSFIDGYGGIHGMDTNIQGADSRTGEPRYRFQGGTYMSHQPANWTGTSGGEATCYFSANKSIDWANCGQHNSTQTGRTEPPQYSRGVPGQY